MSRPWLSVVALGTTGGDPCADGATLGEGVHLLWSLDPGLGFPTGGYDVWRRRHRAPEWVCDEFDPEEGER